MSRESTATVLCSDKRQRASGQLDNKGLKCYHITDILLAKLGRNTFLTTPFSLLCRGACSSGSLHKYLTPLHPPWIQTLAASSAIDCTINKWRQNCQSPTTNIGEYALRNKDLNVLGNQKQSLTASKNDAMESEDFDIFAEAAAPCNGPQLIERQFFSRSF